MPKKTLLSILNNAEKKVIALTPRQYVTLDGEKCLIVCHHVNLNDPGTEYLLQRPENGHGGVGCLKDVHF